MDCKGSDLITEELIPIACELPWTLLQSLRMGQLCTQLLLPSDPEGN